MRSNPRFRIAVIAFAAIAIAACGGSTDSPNETPDAPRQLPPQLLNLPIGTASAEIVRLWTDCLLNTSVTFEAGSGHLILCSDSTAIPQKADRLREIVDKEFIWSVSHSPASRRVGATLRLQSVDESIVASTLYPGVFSTSAFALPLDVVDGMPRLLYNASGNSHDLTEVVSTSECQTG